MMGELAPFQVHAIRYAHLDRQPHQVIIGGDPHSGVIPMDYFVWLAIGGDRAIVIDTGFNAAMAAKRGRHFLRCPTEGLKGLGVDPAAVQDVVLTHLHYDHVGNFDLFPRARYHLQDREMTFVTGRHMMRRPLRESFEVEDVVGMVRAVYDGRVAFHDGDADVVPGLSVHLIGGHSHGLQSVRVWTRRGWLVLASDASHYYFGFLEDKLFPVVFHVGEMLQGYDRLKTLARGPDAIIPGHDPEVMRRYPPSSPALQSIAVRLD